MKPWATVGTEASVIGLGMMGSTLARLLLGSGYRVTVWNRTSAKAESLVREGAVEAPNAAAAVSASPFVVVCVYDYKATKRILGTRKVASASCGPSADPAEHRSPQEARDSEVWARKQGADISTAPFRPRRADGRADTPILISGAASDLPAERTTSQGFRRKAGISGRGDRVGLVDRISRRSPISTVPCWASCTVRASASRKVFGWIPTEPWSPISPPHLRGVSQTRGGGYPFGKLPGLREPPQHLGRSHQAAGPSRATGRDQLAVPGDLLRRECSERP